VVVQWRGFISADSIYVHGNNDGLGDTVHHIRYAVEFALTQPTAKVVLLVHNPEIFDATKFPPNMSSFKAGRDEYQPENLIDFLGRHTVIINTSLALGAHISTRDEYLDREKLPPIIPVGTPMIEHELVLNRPIPPRPRGIWGQRVDLIDAKYRSLEIDPINGWPITVAGAREFEIRGLLRHLYPEIVPDFPHIPFPKSFGLRPSLHQIQDQAFKLRYLLGIQLSDNFEHIPLYAPEIDRSLQKDLLVVYDAHEGGNKKLLEPQQWAQILTPLIQNNNGMCISIVRGLDNPTHADIIVQAVKDMLSGNGNSEQDSQQLIDKCIDIFEAKDEGNKKGLQRFMDRAVAARVVASVDTGLGHMVNELIRNRKRKNLPVPQLVSMFGAEDRGLDPQYYCFDLATTFLSQNRATHLPIDSITQFIQELLTSNS